MAPVEDLQSRDLAWISDFIMQQMVILMRPVIDHLHQTDASVDYAERVVQQLSTDVSEVRSDVERTNKYLAILRQGLGMQNESKCVLQRGLEGTARTVKRLDDQMENVLGVVRSVEDSLSWLNSDVRNSGTRQEELSQLVASSAASTEELQQKIERVGNDVWTLKDSFLESETKMEVWQREMRELRRSSVSLVPPDKVSRAPRSSHSQGREHWPQKKAPSTAPSDDKGNITLAEGGGSRTGSSQLSKRAGRLASGSKSGMLQVRSSDGAGIDDDARRAGDEALLLSPPGAHEVHNRLSALEERLSAASEQLQASREANHGDAARLERRLEAHGGELAGLRRAVGELANEAHSGSKLPLLGAKQTGGAPRPERGSADGPRLRFTATMASQPSRGSPS